MHLRFAEGTKTPVTHVLFFTHFRCHPNIASIALFLKSKIYYYIIIPVEESHKWGRGNVRIVVV